MGQIFDVMAEFFKEDEWVVYPLEGQTVLRMGFAGKNAKWTCYAQAREEQDQFVFYSVCPVDAPEEKRLDMAEFLTRANYGLVVGNFELDFTDGEIRYKTSIDVEGDHLSKALVRAIVYTNIIMMDKYMPGIMALLYANVSPAQAIARVES